MNVIRTNVLKSTLIAFALLVSTPVPLFAQAASATAGCGFDAHNDWRCGGGGDLQTRALSSLPVISTPTPPLGTGNPVVIPGLAPGGGPQAVQQMDAQMAALTRTLDDLGIGLEVLGALLAGMSMAEQQTLVDDLMYMTPQELADFMAGLGTR